VRAEWQYTREPHRGVAQPGSAPALGAGGRGFKSRRPDHLEEGRTAPVPGEGTGALVSVDRADRVRLLIDVLSNPC
jgi:hypothetical protein